MALGPREIARQSDNLSGGAKIAAEKRNRVNDEITAPEVRLIDAERENHGVVSLDRAMDSLARSADH